jgi:hypothetical protein
VGHPRTYVCFVCYYISVHIWKLDPGRRCPRQPHNEYTMSCEDGAQLHADAWCIPDARLSAKCVTEPGAALCTGRFDKTQTYPTALVFYRKFCAGPYVDGTSPNARRDWDWAETHICKERVRSCQPYSIECDAAYDELWALPHPQFLLCRTHSERAEYSPSFLEAGVAWAVYTALRASAACVLPGGSLMCYEQTFCCCRRPGPGTPGSDLAVRCASCQVLGPVPGLVGHLCYPWS